VEGVPSPVVDVHPLRLQVRLFAEPVERGLHPPHFVGGEDPFQQDVAVRVEAEPLGIGKAGGIVRVHGVVLARGMEGAEGAGSRGPPPVSESLFPVRRPALVYRRGGRAGMS
jgi:hypothetical protein